MKKERKLREGCHVILVFFVGFVGHSNMMALHFEGSFDVSHLHSKLRVMSPITPVEKV